MNVTILPEEELEFDKVLVFNTAHITNKDNNYLDHIATETIADSELIVDKFIYGFRVYVAVDYSDDDFDAIVNSARKAGMSDEFSILLHMARTYKANWIKLDCDGSTYSKLPTFEW
jgi:hypothetical protein